MRSLLLVVLAGVSLLLVAAPAHGKTGVRARLSSGVPLAAAPGERITLRWTLGYRDEKGRWRPGFDACGVFVRLVSASGGRPTVGFDSDGACRVHPNGSYAAEVIVPEGGVGEVQIGLRGTTDVRYGGRPTAAGLFFPLDNDSAAAPAAATPSSEHPASAAPGAPQLAVWVTFASLAALAIIAAALHPRRRASGG
jgi:hypothetical protein